MAVRFDINNPNSCQRAYLNYHCYGNTMNISPSDMGAIIARWGDKVESWEKTATTKDSVDYEFDNSDFEKYKDQYKGNGNCVGGEIARGVGDLASPVAAMALKTVAKNGTSKVMNATIEKGAAYLMAKNGAKELGGKAAREAGREAAKNASASIAKETSTIATEETAKALGEGATQKAAEATGKKAGEKAAEEATKNSAQSLGCIIGCTMAAATGAAYWAKQPNKEEVGVVRELNQKMGTAQGNLATQQQEMSSAQNEIVAIVGA